MVDQFSLGERIDEKAEIRATPLVAKMRFQALGGCRGLYTLDYAGRYIQACAARKARNDRKWAPYQAQSEFGR